MSALKCFVNVSIAYLPHVRRTVRVTHEKTELVQYAGFEVCTKFSKTGTK